MLVLAAHELREETYEWNETGQRGHDLLVRSINFEALIVENDLSSIRGGNGVDSQRQVAFVALIARGARQKYGAGARRAGRSDDLAVDRNRLEQHEAERLAGFAFVGRERRGEMKSNVRPGRYLRGWSGRVGRSDRRRNQT
ncbi:MAG: hypothetical protein ABI231_09640 [Candidatus Tumulicola sp.]